MILHTFEHGPDLKFGILSKISKMIGFWKLTAKKKNNFNTFFLRPNLGKTYRRFMIISSRSEVVPNFVHRISDFPNFDTFYL